MNNKLKENQSGMKLVNERYFIVFYQGIGQVSKMLKNGVIGISIPAGMYLNRMVALKKINSHVKILYPEIMNIIEVSEQEINEYFRDPYKKENHENTNNTNKQ